jgi:hypothetical protein
MLRPDLTFDVSNTLGCGLADAAKAQAIRGVSPQDFPRKAGAPSPDKGIKAAGERVVAHLGSEPSVSCQASGSVRFGSTDVLEMSGRCQNGIHAQYLARNVSNPCQMADLSVAGRRVLKSRPSNQIGRLAVGLHRHWMSLARSVTPVRLQGQGQPAQTTRLLQGQATYWQQIPGASEQWIRRRPSLASAQRPAGSIQRLN